MSANPFDLAARKVKGPARAHHARDYNAAEQNELLRDYQEIVPKYWHLIPWGTPVRYYTIEGEFRYGGYVKTNPSGVPRDNPGAPPSQMTLQNSTSDKIPGYSTWVVDYEKTSRVFARRTATEATQHEFIVAATTLLRAKIKEVGDAVADLSERVRALEGSSSRR